MAAQPDAVEKPRRPLTRDRVLGAAVELADTRGIDSLTMRNLAGELGVEAMSLYNHVANKEDVLDGIAAVVVAEVLAAVDEVEASGSPGEWKQALRRRILAARAVLLRHRWAPGVLESRTNAPPGVLEHTDSLLGLMREGGLSVDLAHHAMHALGTRALGFTRELFVSDDGDREPETPAAMPEPMASRYPYVAELTRVVSHDPGSSLGSGCDDQFEFEFGLDLILDGLERLRDAE